MKLFALTFGGVESASTQYRLFQYENLMQQNGIQFEWEPASTFKDFNRLKNYDAVILQKTLLSPGKINRIRKNSKRFIYDADDRIWLSPNKEYNWFTRKKIGCRLKAIAACADICTVANSVIEKDLLNLNAKTTVIPMSLEKDTWVRPQHPHDTINIGWSGAPKNLVFLDEILPILKELQRTCSEIRFIIHSGADPKFNNLVYQYIPFEDGKEPEATNLFDIGLVPLPDNEFAKGKSPIKSIQYSASNCAIVCSPVGAIKDIMKDGQTALYANSFEDWKVSLFELAKNQTLRATMAGNALNNFLEKHEKRVVFNQLQKILKNC